MDTVKRMRRLNNTATGLFEFAVRAVLGALLVLLLATIFWATVRTFVEVKSLFGEGVHAALRVTMVNSLAILAILEVFKTGLAYLSVGRVRVTYIIDTVIVVVLGEVMVFWFREIDYTKILMVIGIVFSLILARILTIRYSPLQTRTTGRRQLI